MFNPRVERRGKGEGKVEEEKTIREKYRYKYS